VTDYLRAGVDHMFPGAVLFGVSALDELSRIKDEPRPLPERSLSLAARFDALRAHLKESIVDNRELIQIDRASAEFKRLLQSVVQHADQVRWAIDTDRTRLDEAIDACENTSSALHSRMKDDAARLRSTLTALGCEARDWLGLFLDRLEKVAQDLGAFSADDLQRHFPFFLADALRTAIHGCLEAHRPLILAAIRQSADPRLEQPETSGFRRDSTPELPDVLHAAVAESRLKTSAAHATAGDAVWDRLELSKMLFDLAQTQVFGVAAGLMRHLDESGRERQKSVLYQQQFSSALPQLRRSVLDQAGEVYDSIARRLAEEMERQQQQDLETSLEAFRQGRHLVAAGDATRDLALLDRVSTLVQETQEALSALQRKWWSESVEGASDGGSNLALESPASS
jgi:exonuclease VII small subunit